MKKQVNGYEIVSSLPPAITRPRDAHRNVRIAIEAAGIGNWVVIPVPASHEMNYYRNLLLQGFRKGRTGWKLTTRIDRPSRKLFIARTA